LILPDTAKDASYRATLTTPEGHEVWSRQGLKMDTKGAAITISLTLPALELAQNDYELTVSKVADSSSEEVAYYYFTLLRN
jgi:hypothetical protein